MSGDVGSPCICANSCLGDRSWICSGDKAPLVSARVASISTGKALKWPKFAEASSPTIDAMRRRAPSHRWAIGTDRSVR